MSLGIATTVSQGGETIYWSRWLFYCGACSLLMYDTAKVQKIPNSDYPKMAILTILTMFNGFLASYTVISFKWVFYILSSVAFLGLLYIVLQGQDNPDFKSLKLFVLGGWTLFPIVFLLAPTGLEILTTTTSEASYLLFDFITKIVFGFMTSKLK